MSDATSVATPSPFVSILNWSRKWPVWQQDALRRIVGSGTLSPNDLKELSSICRAKHGLLPATGIVPAPIPLAEEHIPGGADGTASVSLSKLSGLQNVGRLPSDQEIVFGDAPGLTVIYGENGAGKSGYARVIKKACRARGTPQDIKPDAFAPPAVGPAKASITFRASATELQFDWRDGVASDPLLGNIFVFDTLSARVHVGEDGPACFKPRGLDVLPELAKACDTVNEELKADLKLVSEKNAAALKGWTYKAATKVGMLLNAINADTNPDSIDAVAVFTEVDEMRLTELISTLSDDPKKKSAETSARAKRIREFAVTAMSRATSVDDTAMQSVHEAIKEADTTIMAAKAAAEPDLKATDLPGSCNEVWLKLWNAAKEYSVEYAYPDKQFPVTGADAKCVLCQQSLQPEAIDRYARFNKFVANETRKNADGARAKVADLKKGVDPLRAILVDAASIKADLDREAAGTFAVVEEFAKAVDARIAHAQKCLKEGAWTSAPALTASPCAELVTLADSLDKRANDELAAADPDKAKVLAAEREGLTDKKWLAEKKDEVKAQIERHAHAAKLKKCQEDCTTNTITRKVGELEESHVNQAFRDAFKNELQALGMKTLPVKLDAARPIPGQRRHGVRVEGVAIKPNGDPVHRVDEIASEGEHRCIALAAFMAELSLASHMSALVFDDPVSSLDHKRREEIAKRLVREAEIRQVIVFTHDLAFVCDLEGATSGGRASIHCQHIEWRAGKPGSVASGLIWDAKSTRQQLKDLRERIGRAEKIKNEGTDSEYKSAVGPIVDDMRSACERIIEDELLGDLLKRHSSQIKVGHVDRVAKVRAEDWLAIKGVWSKCSDATPAHANAKSGPHKVPEPDTLKEWMKVLEDTIDEVKNSRNRSSGAEITESKPKSLPAPQPLA